MADVVIQTGTVDELAGVRVGSGNVWVRPGDLVESVSLALPDEQSVVVPVGGHVYIDRHRCTLLRIEPVIRTGSHLLHFAVESLDEASPAPDRRDPAEANPSDDAVVTRELDLVDPAGLVTTVRDLSAELLRLIGSNVVPAPQGWSRTSREDWVEIDRVPCGPTTTTTWTWADPATGPTETADGREARCEVVETTVRWNPEEVHDHLVAGTWGHGDKRLHVSVAGLGPRHHLRVAGSADLIERGAEAVTTRLQAG